MTRGAKYTIVICTMFLAQSGRANAQNESEPKELQKLKDTERTEEAVPRSPAGNRRYLCFQVFTYFEMKKPPVLKPADFQRAAKPEIEKVVKELLAKIKTTGDGKHTQLGIILGPLTLNHSVSQLREFINGGFQIAKKNNIAVGFHFSDNFFWSLRTDLTGVPANIEWTNWDGGSNKLHQSKSRKIGWLPLERFGKQLAPSMNYASPALRKEVKRILATCSKEINSNLTHLRKDGKEHLFAGVIVGWESRLDDDSRSESIGYGALTHKGFTKDKPPKAFDLELNKITFEWVEHWSRSFSDSGISKDKIFTHLPLTNKELHKRIHSPPDNAFNSYSTPGFTVNPKTGIFDTIDLLLKKHKRKTWANCEGVNLTLDNPFVTQAGATTIYTYETFLAKHYNHGAVMVNLFGWQTPNQFGKSVRGEDGIAAYRKFLNNETLIETKPKARRPDTPLARMAQNLPERVRAYLKRGGSRALITGKLDLLNKYTRERNHEKAGEMLKEIHTILDK